MKSYLGSENCWFLLGTQWLVLQRNSALLSRDCLLWRKPVQEVLLRSGREAADLDNGQGEPGGLGVGPQFFRIDDVGLEGFSEQRTSMLPLEDWVQESINLGNIPYEAAPLNPLGGRGQSVKAFANTWAGVGHEHEGSRGSGAYSTHILGTGMLGKARVSQVHTRHRQVLGKARVSQVHTRRRQVLGKVCVSQVHTRRRQVLGKAHVSQVHTRSGRLVCPRCILGTGRCSGRLVFPRCILGTGRCSGRLAGQQRVVSPGGCTIQISRSGSK